MNNDYTFLTILKSQRSEQDRQLKWRRMERESSSANAPAPASPARRRGLLSLIAAAAAVWRTRR